MEIIMNGIEIIYENNEIKVKSFLDDYYKDAELNSEEQWFCEKLSEIVGEDFKIVRRSKSYLTILVDDFDYIRFNIGIRSKWFSLFFNKYIKNKYIDDSRFLQVKNKNLLHWRVDIEETEDILKYADVIREIFQNSSNNYI